MLAYSHHPDLVALPEPLEVMVVGMEAWVRLGARAEVCTGWLHPIAMQKHQGSTQLVPKDNATASARPEETVVETHIALLIVVRHEKCRDSVCDGVEEVKKNWQEIPARRRRVTAEKGPAYIT